MGQATRKHARLFPTVILAGGLATRLRPITETIPKCLVQVGGVPFIDIQLQQLVAEGVTDVILLVGYLGELVREHIGDGSKYGLRVVIVQDGPKLLGTAGALRAALEYLPDKFFVLYGDSYLRCSYRAVQEKYLGSGSSGLMTVFLNNGQWDTSNVEYSEGEVKAYSKKQLTPAMHYIDYGLMIVSRETIARLPSGEPYDLASVLQEEVQAGRVCGFEVTERFYEIGSHAGLCDLEEFLAQQQGRYGHSKAN
jgi:MurNAc alpha-1-phosphate uridylyltransferase